jgi:hypothetical protein
MSLVWVQCTCTSRYEKKGTADALRITRHTVGFVLISFPTPNRVYVYQIFWYLGDILACKDNFLLLRVWSRDYSVLHGWHVTVRLCITFVGYFFWVLVRFADVVGWQCYFVKLDLIECAVMVVKKNWQNGCVQGALINSALHCLHAFFQDV